MAFQIIRHAFRMVFGNLTDALKVSVGPYLILTVATVLAMTAIAETGGLLTPEAQMGLSEEMNGTAILFIFGLVLFTLFVVSWVAVAWHRFVLLEEYPGFLPAVAGRPIGAYMGRSIVYGLLLVLAALPVLFVFALVAPALVGMGGAAGALGFVIVSGFMTYLWFRIGLALPSIAVGKPITLGEAWSATKDMSGTILGVAFLLMGLNGVATIVVGQVSTISGGLGMIFNLALQWTILMLSVSILTTFYGHLIEGRDLPN